MDHAYARIGGGDLVEQLGRTVRATVVDQHQLELVVGDRGAGASDEFLDELLLVEDGRHDAEQGGGAKWGIRHDCWAQWQGWGGGVAVSLSSTSALSGCSIYR